MQGMGHNGGMSAGESINQTINRNKQGETAMTWKKIKQEARDLDLYEGLISLDEYLDESDNDYDDACDDADEWYDAQIDRG